MLIALNRTVYTLHGKQSQMAAGRMNWLKTKLNNFIEIVFGFSIFISTKWYSIFEAGKKKK